MKKKKNILIIVKNLTLLSFSLFFAILGVRLKKRGNGQKVNVKASTRWIQIIPLRECLMMKFYAMFILRYYKLK